MLDWRKLERAGRSGRKRSIAKHLDSDRVAAFSVSAGDLYLDYSKTSMTEKDRDLLVSMYAAAGVDDRREAMFSGEKINETENRAALHTAQRNLDGGPVMVDGTDVVPGVREGLNRMAEFAGAVRAGKITAPGGRRFTDVVNIGIGGSDLGPAMATLALAPYHDGPQCHFVSNVDGAHVYDVLSRLSPQTTLVIVASKTFTTIETMTNAETARAWVAASVGAEVAGGHFAAVSTALDRTEAFGIASDRVFTFEDWLGGRYSLWGPIGLSLMLAVGDAAFRAMLRGGQAMDTHFRAAAPLENLPVMLALTGIWHHQGCGYPTRAVLPYDQRLLRLPAYLQQLEMESNGKAVSMDGSDLPVTAGPVVWGEPGTNGQHAFYQLIHQGADVVPCEFMVGAEGHHPELAHHHSLLLANCLAQSKALMEGRNLPQARMLMKEAGYKGAELDRQARHRVFRGNRPSTTLIYPKLTPFVLGQLIALHEHRVFVEGVMLGINSFDQWGVELGKELAKSLQPLVEGGEGDTDASTRGLLEVIRTHRGETG